MALTSDGLPDFRRESLRGTPGYFRVGCTHAGQWWLIAPDGQPFFMKAVHGVAAAESAHDPVARLRRWGFNTLGCGSERLHLEDGLAFMRAANFTTAGSGVNMAGVRLPDVFDPAWPGLASARAEEVCTPLAESPNLLGWLTDDGPNWPAAAAPDRPGLLQICLSLEPDRAAYHAAWEFVLALRGGSVAALAAAWGVPLGNKEALRAMTKREEGIVTPGYLQDEVRWTAEFAQRYFAGSVAAIRRHAPFHLVLGCRWTTAVNATLRAACAAAVDVCLIDYDDVATNPAGPVLIGDFSWAKKSFREETATRRLFGPTAVERMLRRGRLGLSRAVANPAVVGYAWSHWRDRAGEQAPFGSGLVRENDAEAREHTELLTAINDRVEELRAMALPEEEEIL